MDPPKSDIGGCRKVDCFYRVLASEINGLDDAKRHGAVDIVVEMGVWLWC